MLDHPGDPVLLLLLLLHVVQSLSAQGEIDAADAVWYRREGDLHRHWPLIDLVFLFVLFVADGEDVLEERPGGVEAVKPEKLEKIGCAEDLQELIIRTV